VISFQIIFELFVTQELKDFPQISKFQTLRDFGQKKKKRLHSSNGQSVDSLHEKADGRTDTVNIHGVTGYVLTCWKNKASKARRKKVAGWKRAQFLPHKVGTKIGVFL